MRHDEAADWPLPSPTRSDFADAASARRDGGAPRLLRRRVLRALAARLMDRHPDAIRFARDASGALRLDGIDASVSVAGCRGWSAVALAPSSIGLDIEEDDPCATDLVRWVLVEAYLKALGTGLAIGPEQVRMKGHAAVSEGRVDLDSRHIPVCLSLPGTDAHAAQAWLQAPAPGIIAAVAVLSAERVGRPLACPP